MLGKGVRSVDIRRKTAFGHEVVEGFHMASVEPETSAITDAAKIFIQALLTAR